MAERGLVSCLPSLGAPARRMVQSDPALVHAAEILQQVPRWLNFPVKILPPKICKEVLWAVKAWLGNVGFGVSKAVCLGADVQGFPRGPREGQGRGVCVGESRALPLTPNLPVQTQMGSLPGQPAVPQPNLGIWQIPV